MNPSAPLDVDALNRIAGEALRGRDFVQARAALEQLVAARPADPGAWFGLAIACVGLGDDPGKLRALDGVLAGDPGHLLALMMKGDHFAAAGDGRAAQTFYRAVMARAPDPSVLRPDLQREVRRAAERSAHYERLFVANLNGALAKAGFDPARSSRRFADSVDLMMGRKQLYPQAPTSFYFPELPQRQFYERSEFPWISTLEAQTDAIREELMAVVADETAFRPYVASDGARPPVEFGGLRDSLDWSAYFLVRGGEVQPEASARCPKTMAALAKVPLTAAAGRIPSVLFSRLQPGACIPPHNGEINARLICHLPLVTPPGCALRVGNETRPWVKGQTLIFDDSIEHEAWNTSNQVRVVLLFEIWRPELTAEERDLVAALLAAVGSA